MSKKVRPAPCRHECPKRYVWPSLPSRMSKKVRLALPAVTNVQKGTSGPPCRHECPKRYVWPSLPSRVSKKVRPAPCRHECPKRYVWPSVLSRMSKKVRPAPCRHECPKRYVWPSLPSGLSYRHECPKRYVSSCRADAVCLWVWGLCWASSRPVGGHRHALAAAVRVPKLHSCLGAKVENSSPKKIECKNWNKIWNMNVTNVENYGDFTVMVLVAVLWQSLMTKHPLRVGNLL